MDNQVDSEGSTAGTTALEIASVRQRISAGLVDAVIRDSDRSGWWVAEVRVRR